MKRAYKLLAVLLGVLVLGGCAQRGAAPASVPSSAAPTPGSVQAFPENGLEPVDTTVLADLQRRAAAVADVCRPWLEQQQPGGAEALRTCLLYTSLRPLQLHAGPCGRQGRLQLFFILPYAAGK